LDAQSRLNKARTDRRDLINSEGLKKAIAEAELDAVIATSPYNATYCGGNFIPRASLLVCILTTMTGQQASVINEADAHYFKEYSWIQDIRSFQYADTTLLANTNAIRLWVDLLKERGLSQGKIGLELMYLPAIYSEMLARLLPDATFKEAGQVFNQARLIKTPAEIELFRIAAYNTDKAIQTAFAMARPGDTEKDIAAQMQANTLRSGADALDHTVLSSGVQGTVVHAMPMAKPVQLGEVIHVDFGGVFAGYCTDLARNAVVGKPSPKQVSIYQRLCEIHHKLLDRVRPGVVGKDLFAFSEAEFAKAGLVYPWGTLGHSTGLLVHEGFEITKNQTMAFQPGMLINIEPTHIESGDARYHIEDTVLVTENGIETLSSFSNTGAMFEIK
jgi:Xaa-Pro aminopeptidase